MKYQNLLIPATFLLLLGGQSQADDLSDAARALCDSIKTCALEQVASQQELTDEVKQQMTPLLDNMCTSMQSQVADVPVDHPLYQPAVGCLRSMVSLDCQQMQSAAGIKTPECQEYHELATKSGSIQ
ncbi:MAG: hypothetical protein AAGF35_10180 [Pseudomonadota bacterium]